MTSFKFLIIIILSIFLIGCNDKSNTGKINFSIETDAPKNTIALGKPLKLSLKNPNNIAFTSVSYTLNNQPVDETFTVENVKLGTQTITAKVAYSNTFEEVTTNITILNNTAPKIYSYKIINIYTHDITSYTQGLEFYNDELYESTGQYGESKLRKTDYKTGNVLKNVDLQKHYFGEGLTVLNNTIYQLTWQESIGFIYNAETFEQTGSFKYGQSKEGWGLCNDGKQLYKTDGSDKIWTLNPKTLAEEDYIQIYTHSGKIGSLNELEWIDNKIYANIYQRNGVAIINPKNGAVEGVIDFSPLKTLVTQHQGLDVLNGIAYNPKTNTVFVTGKRWDKLFEVDIFEE